MTEAKRFLYLDREDFRRVHALLVDWSHEGGEPIPSFGFAKEAELQALIAAPQRQLNGQDIYSSLAEKAAIIFYTINKSQIFMNGNKRMSTVTLVVFLALNGKALDILPNELTAKALWLANTESSAFQATKKELTEWISDHLVDDLSGAPLFR